MTGYRKYARTSIETSDPRQVVVLLYEGLVKFLYQALEAVEADDKNGMSTCIKKAQAIIHYLTNSLDHENGAEVAGNLDRLYAYMRDQLAQANLKCDAEPMREVIELIKPLLEAWREIAKDPEAAAALQSRKADPTATPIDPANKEQPADTDSRMDTVRVAAENPTPNTTPKHSAPRPNAVSLAGRAAYGIH